MVVEGKQELRIELCLKLYMVPGGSGGATVLIHPVLKDYNMENSLTMLSEMITLNHEMENNILQPEGRGGNPVFPKRNSC